MNAMEIVNSIGWRTGWLRRVVAYCCRQLGYPPSRVRKATFRKSHRGEFSGGADLGCREVQIKIDPRNRYPLDAGGYRGLAATAVADAVEALLLVTAHEVAHLERWERFARDWRRRGKRDVFKERDTESLARGVLAAFRADRERLLSAWGAAGPGPVPPRYVYRTECPSCGSFAVHPRPSRKMYCVACHGKWKPGMPDPAFLECRRLPAAGEGRRGGIPWAPA
jgi:hypothetical protein